MVLVDMKLLAQYLINNQFRFTVRKSGNVSYMLQVLSQISSFFHVIKRGIVPIFTEWKNPFFFKKNCYWICYFAFVNLNYFFQALLCIDTVFFELRFPYNPNTYSHYITFIHITFFCFWLLTYLDFAVTFNLPPKLSGHIDILAFLQLTNVKLCTVNKGRTKWS